MRLIDVPPIHDRYEVADAKLVAPGSALSFGELLTAPQGNGRRAPQALSIVPKSVRTFLN